MARVILVAPSWPATTTSTPRSSSTIRQVEDLDGGPGYPVLGGDYRVGARWEPAPLPAGRRVAAPKPVFRKLDPSIVDEELARLGG